tara:strand:+ start:478 stop:798 length:321 start_codon:yes stop_codon:yes gene_type:complete
MFKFPKHTIESLKELSQSALLDLIIKADFNSYFHQNVKFGSVQWDRCQFLLNHGKQFLNEASLAEFAKYEEDEEKYMYGENYHDTSDMSAENEYHFWEGFYSREDR